MSTLAVFIALGGGAYAAAVVSRAKVANNALRLGGVPARQYHQDVMAGVNTNTITLTSSNPQPVITGKLYNSSRGKAGFTSLGNVNVVNPGPDPEELTLLLRLNNRQEPISFTNTIAPGTRQTVPAIFAFEPKCKKCGLLNFGNNDVQLLARAQGKGQLTVEDSSIFALRPIVIPPGRSACCGPMPLPPMARDSARGRRP
jgi:hypothetical protein